MAENLDRYIPVTEFIAEMMGPDTEVILYSVTDRSVYYVINPMDEEMVVGSGLRFLGAAAFWKIIFMTMKILWSITGRCQSIGTN